MRFAYCKSDPAFRAALRARYRYILVDEFRTPTSRQIELLWELAADHRNVVAVGVARKPSTGSAAPRLEASRFSSSASPAFRAAIAPGRRGLSSRWWIITAPPRAFCARPRRSPALLTTRRSFPRRSCCRTSPTAKKSASWNSRRRKRKRVGSPRKSSACTQPG